MEKARIHRVSVPVDEQQNLVADLERAHRSEPFDCVVLFVSPAANADDLVSALRTGLPDVRLVGCTTAGEITDCGYADGHVVALGLPSSQFVTASFLVEDLACMERERLAGGMARLRYDLRRSHADWSYEVAFLLVDGLCKAEDQLVAAVGAGLGAVPLFGGSAGDGLTFGETKIICDDHFQSNAAVVTVIRSRCRLEVFRFDHLQPTETKMVVTEADPERRVVRSINAEPAAREYARLVGVDPDQLSPFMFASHPVVVKVGGEHHVRAIQKVEDNGDLTFFSAIDEGLVLTVACARDMVDHLDRSLGGLTNGTRPDLFIGCDCLLRRLEAEQFQTKHQISDVLKKHGVFGFNTYGEQFNSAHVNQTLTGLAIYPPEPIKER